MAAESWDTKNWQRLSRTIMQRDGWRCLATCGCTRALTVHHIIPRAEGGTDDPDNLITLCRQCHDEIEGTSIRTREQVRIYDAAWHDTVTWYPTEPARDRVVRSRRLVLSVRLFRPRRSPDALPNKQRGDEVIARERIVATCVTCGKEFESRRRGVMYCSRACRPRYIHQRTYDKDGGKRLDEIRRERGESLTQFGALLGVMLNREPLSRQYVSGMAHGRFAIPDDVAHALGVLAAMADGVSELQARVVAAEALFVHPEDAGAVILPKARECALPGCRVRFVGYPAQRFCSVACRRESHRRNKKGPE